jgi:protein SCO1/2
MVGLVTWNQDTPEETLAAFVDLVRTSPERVTDLVDLLSERHPVYVGRSTNATSRMRGYLLAAFENVGLPSDALPYVFEELETGRDAYLVAAAAKALRGSASPSNSYAPFLATAIKNIRFMDDAVTFEEYKPTWPLKRFTTAMDELIQTLLWMGPEAYLAVPALESLLTTSLNSSHPANVRLSEIVAALRSQSQATQTTCCGCGSGDVTYHDQASANPSLDSTRHEVMPLDILLEDHEGNLLQTGDFFRDRPTIVVFFYTRCDNPNKCSLTISKLARLQTAISRAGFAEHLQTAAITYDPAFDLAPRLRDYGETRGVIFNDRNRFFRTVTGFDQLREFFTLGVNYGPALVNRHRIELFLVDRNGLLVDEFTRLQWDVDEVLATATALLTQPAPSFPAPKPRHIALAMATDGAHVAGEVSGCCASALSLQTGGVSSE